MKFDYRKFPVNKENCPIPNKFSSLRPVIDLVFDTPKGKFRYFALIDSGADYCIFHASMGEVLGIEIKSGKPLTFFGTSGQPQQAYFHDVSFTVGGSLHACYAGFSYDMENLAYGILGQDGFFDKWIVKFEYIKERLELIQVAA